MDWETWGPPIAVLVVGVVAGVLVAVQASDGTVESDADQDLRARHAQLLEQLRALQVDEARLGPAEFARQKDALVREAASVLRQLEDADDPPTASPAGASPSIGKAVAWIVGTLAFFGAAAAILVQTAKPRDDAQMGGGMAPMQAAAQEAERELADAQATLETNPQDLEALNVMGHHAIMNQQLQEAMQYVDQARAIDGEDPHVVTHLGALQLLVGMHDKAEASFAQAVGEDAALAEAWIWWAVSLGQQGDADGAKTKLQQALQVATRVQDQAAAHSLLADLEKMSAPAAFSGTVTLAEGATADQGVLYVYARRSEVAAGPPLAALRLPRWSLPQAFVLTDGDLLPMAGGAWPEQVWVSAKLDVDGDPATDSPDDLTAVAIGPIPAGTSDVTIVLGGEAEAEAPAE